MHRQRRTLAARTPAPARRYAAAFEHRAIVATYELHDRLLSNRRARQRFSASRPPLDVVQQRIVAELNAEGFAKLSLAELVADKTQRDDLERQGDDFIAATEEGLRREAAGDVARDLRRRPGKEFVVRANSFEGVRLDLDDPWLRTALSSRFLDVANAYLRMWTKLSYVDLWYTVPEPATEARKASQNWHLDFDDKYLLKAFLYLSDVDADSGPFEYVPGSQAGGRYGDRWSWAPMGDCSAADADVARYVPAGSIATFTAPRGTLIFCNTSGLHRGGFATGNPRVLATATYCSPASVAALSNRNYAFGGDAGALDPAARHAIS